MRALFVTAVAVVALLASAEAFGFAGGGGKHAAGNTNGSASVPEPASIFAVSSGLLLVGAASWYVRRRK